MIILDILIVVVVLIPSLLNVLWKNHTGSQSIVVFHFKHGGPLVDMEQTCMEKTNGQAECMKTKIIRCFSRFLYFLIGCLINVLGPHSALSLYQT